MEKYEGKFWQPEPMATKYIVPICLDHRASHNHVMDAWVLVRMELKDNLQGDQPLLNVTVINPMEDRKAKDTVAARLQGQLVRDEQHREVKEIVNKWVRSPARNPQVVFQLWTCYSNLNVADSGLLTVCHAVLMMEKTGEGDMLGRRRAPDLQCGPTHLRTAYEISPKHSSMNHKGK
ncbi:hypothetical protein PG995_009535 [Apiospora arundinis]